MRLRSQEHHMRYAAFVAAALMLIQPAKAEKTPEVDPRAVARRRAAMDLSITGPSRIMPCPSRRARACFIRRRSRSRRTPESISAFVAGAIGSNPAKAEQLVAGFFPGAAGRRMGDHPRHRLLGTARLEKTFCDGSRRECRAGGS
jgi:hypothetical protein